MKNSSFRNFNSKEFEILSKDQMKNAKGGVSDGSTFCDWNASVFYVANGITYRCSVNYSQGFEECCCGHDDGNANCQA